MKPNGFTLVELIIVIVILGILAVTAAPKFIDLSGDANKSNTISVQSSFYESVKLINYKWIVQGKPSTVEANGESILMSDEGFPNRSTDDNDGCLEIWNNVMDTSINIVSYPGAVATPEWSALRFGPACVYINHNGAVFVNTETPFFSYFPTTGTGAGFNLD